VKRKSIYLTAGGDRGSVRSAASQPASHTTSPRLQQLRARDSSSRHYVTDESLHRRPIRDDRSSGHTRRSNELTKDDVNGKDYGRRDAGGPRSERTVSRRETTILSFIKVPDEVTACRSCRWPALCVVRAPAWNIDRWRASERK